MERRAIEISGIVQGVGFRPFVWGLAARHGLGGFVKNQEGAVLIEIEGEPRSLDAFLSDIEKEPPPLARIDHICWESCAKRGETQFRIDPSAFGETRRIFVSPDVSTCRDCLAELFDPSDRRYQYPFTNCTHCGPRLTIITGAPYDRERTTMAPFAMCQDCTREYHDPADRRFHAQPIACARCGPTVEARDAAGNPLACDDPIVHFAAALRAGSIGALKGLGGYHLVCDARREPVVAELRRRKQRDAKPFAVMVRTIEAAAALCMMAPNEADLLQSRRAPIVLLRKRPAAEIADAVAPGNPYLGVMLPYTPLHHLLLDVVGGVPLVMTSGNRSEEPIAYEDDDAVVRLDGIADLFLVHNRPIHIRCDDSVTRIVAGRESLMRRSRGYAPEPIGLPWECPAPILAVGGQLKATFALARGRHAFLSHHLGDLDHYDAYRAFVRDVALYEQLFDVHPEAVVHDLYEDYASTTYARQRSTADRIRALAVQHHHAHVASCMAEHGLSGPVLGVAFDGTGFGTDGTIWGGEFLIADCRRFRRGAHLRNVSMPGGDRAVRAPWRMAVAHLVDASAECPALERRILPNALRLVRATIARRFNAPLTSSAGRLFDAVAALVGLRDEVAYEGQAAMELEWSADGMAPDGSYPFDLEEVLEGEPAEPTLIVDTRPLILAVAHDVRQGTDAARIARRFHTAMVEIIASVCSRLRTTTGLSDVVLSGGVFLNALLTAETEARLCADGFHVYRQTLVPPNDGGLSLGQLAIAAAQLSA